MFPLRLHTEDMIAIKISPPYAYHAHEAFKEKVSIKLA